MVGCGGESYLPSDFAEREPAAFARLAVEADTSADRSFFLADGGTFFYDALAGEPTDPAMGFIVGDFRLVDGWRWWSLRDSTGLGPNNLTGGVVRPDFVARAYQQADTSGFIESLIRRVQGDDLSTLTEVVTLAAGALYVEVPDSVGTVELIPTFSDRRAPGDYEVQTQGGTLLVARGNFLEAREGNPRPVWLAVASESGQAMRQGEELTDALGARDRGVALGRVRFETPGVVAFASGNTPEEAAQRAQGALAGRERRLEQRTQRLIEVLDRSTIRTEDEAFNRAFDWARLSLDALAHEDSVRFTFTSGIPGAEAPTGRSTLTAFEGALLATGRWEEARKMLLTYGRAQRRDRRLDVFGRIPNEFAGDRPLYTTVDATPVFVDAVGDYLRTTGDRGLITANGAEFWTRTVYAVRGLYDDVATPDGYLGNRAGQTWVQPYDGRGRTPRVNRAVEAQGRFYRALRSMQPIARIMGQISGRPTSAAAYGDSAAALQRRFERDFVRDDRIADVLTASGAPSGEFRPSPLLALRDLDLDPETERRVLRRIASDLVYQHGVSTRLQTDSLFYPFLNEPDYYEAGAARYDGTVWTWLSGPLVSLLVDAGAADRAYDQTESLVHLILDRGVVGAAAENLDAHPHRAGEAGDAEGDASGEPYVGGAPVQPWTLAEFVRNAYQDYAGIRYQNGRTVVLEPHLPDSWGETVTTFRLGDGTVRATMQQDGSELSVGLVPEGRLPRGANVRVQAFGNVKVVPLVQVQGDTLALPLDSLSLAITADEITLGGEAVEADSSYTTPDADFWSDFAWAEPEVVDEYPVMRQVKRARQLDASQVSRTNPLAIPTLTRTDPDGDDWGTTATYTYPTDFPPSVLDASYLEVAEDDSTTYFRIEMAALTSAAELGYQPTLIALAFDTEEGGKVEVGRNSRYVFTPKSAGYEYIVFVGDGLEVEDAGGRQIGAFPELGDALFSAEEALITFSLPKFVLPDLGRGTSVTLLVGARADGGEVRFRDVGERATTLVGGGKINRNDPNIYDVVNARIER